jgi:hypothetical protein
LRDTGWESRRERDRLLIFGHGPKVVVFFLVTAPTQFQNQRNPFSTFPASSRTPLTAPASWPTFVPTTTSTITTREYFPPRHDLRIWRLRLSKSRAPPPPLIGNLHRLDSYKRPRCRKENHALGHRAGARLTALAPYRGREASPGLPHSRLARGTKPILRCSHHQQSHPHSHEFVLDR